MANANYIIDFFNFLFAPTLHI